MGTMNISLPETLRLQPLLLEGAQSPPSGEADPRTLRTLHARGAAHRPAKRRA